MLLKPIVAGTFALLFRQLHYGVFASPNNLMGWESASGRSSEGIRRHTHSTTSGFFVQDDSFELHDIHNIPNGFDVEAPKASPPPLEVIPLIISGPSTNRVDLVFFSDGYLPKERQKFIDDALRLAEDVSKNQTFNTVQPLLNFWAAFSPSNETGIGIDTPKETPFGLYREGTELRGVYYAYPEVGRAACDSLEDQCDYPIFLGNDPMYGGLGGDFTVITASILNGPLVLRHELGHSILEVGEEYDGGYAYFGSNAGHDTKDFPWKRWLSNPSRINEHGGPRVERSVMAMQAYPWTLLNMTTPWSISFSSSGTYERYSIQFSLSGIPDKDDLRVTLDDIDLGWEPRSAVGMDRWFYNFLSSVKLSPGTHELKFHLLNDKNEGTAQLCSAEILEYGSEEEFVMVPAYYGLYPTYSDVNQTSYRPTNDDCLMRLVTSPNFCKVCLETLWLNLLKNVSFIDGINERCTEPSDSSAAMIQTLHLDLLPLGHLRKPHTVISESYTIFWEKDGRQLIQHTNQTEINIDDDPVGEYTATVRFSTHEVKVDSPKLQSKLSYRVVSSCSTRGVS